MKEETKKTYRILYLPCEDPEVEVDRITDDGYRVIYISDIYAFFQKDIEMAVHARHATIDSSLFAKMPSKEHWIEYAHQKTQGEA